MKHLIYIAIIFLFATSCKKKTAVVIQAQDITSDGAAYAGQEYAVAESWTPFQETKSKIVATGFLDANGKASFNLKMKNNRKYVLGVSEPDNICYGGLVQHYLDHEKNNNVIFEYAECAYIKLKIDNVNCQGLSDKFVLYRKNQIGSIDGDFGWQHDGCVYWESNGYSTVPMGEQYYRWEVTRSGNTSTYYDTIYLQEGEQRMYEINY
ncbi:hypothetical protein [Brumimicrobium oceani]|uniref:Uncharacterized protein n=1 Tax=Brumimicrobium oceani TaxID=2100725 RepID=A0A2U2XAD7_9FLAO|nr:hypothetical protein [Brumimicrobium oceani]PWH84756.1 hypothetical protein DIT68_12560 [Brumimicrobium oceani]